MSRYGCLGSVLDCHVRQGIGISDPSNTQMAVWLMHPKRLSVRTDIARKQARVTDEKPHNGERLDLELAARVIRRLFFATGILLGLAFAVACYAEMLGVVRFD
jgi:hypothetical protein